MDLKKTLEQKLDEGRQYRRFDVSGAEWRAEGEDEKIVQGYATVFNKPYELWREDDYIIMEQVDARAFDDCDMSDVIMQYDHQGRVFARGSNGTLQVGPDDVGLKIRAELGGTEIGRQLYEEIAGGYTTKMSFGFRVAEDRRETVENYEEGKVMVLRTITRISRLFDVSAVSLPANDATSISARAWCDGAIAQVKEEFRARKERERQKQRIRILANI